MNDYQKINYIPEQLAVIHSTEDNIKVMAGAGTGKTATLVGLSEHRSSERMLYIAFNKAIQLEATGRFGKGNVECRTGHSIAYGIEAIKYRHKLAPFVKAADLRSSLGMQYQDAFMALSTLNAYLYSADISVDEDHAMIAGVKPVNRSKIANYANEIWKCMIDPNDGRVPMIHDGYLKLFHLHGHSFNGIDTVLMDEAQDANPVISAIIGNQSMRKIYVGDRNQSIYAFRGAENAMDKIKAKEYALTSSFRFGQNIADVANLILQYTLGDSMRMKGLGGESDIREDRPQGKYAYLARTNSSLFNAAIDAIDNDKTVGAIGGTKAMRLDLILDTYNLMIGDKTLIKNQTIKQFVNYDEMKKLSSDMEDAELMTLCSAVERHKNKTPYLIKKIESEVGEPAANTDITLSTAHRAKGLEFDHVVLSEDFEDPSDQDGVTIQSGNLLYVAITRAKKSLTLNYDMRKFIEKPVKNALLEKEKISKFNRPS